MIGRKEQIPKEWKFSIFTYDDSPLRHNESHERSYQAYDRSGERDLNVREGHSRRRRVDSNDREEIRKGKRRFFVVPRRVAGRLADDGRQLTTDTHLHLHFFNRFTSRTLRRIAEPTALFSAPLRTLGIQSAR